MTLNDDKKYLVKNSLQCLECGKILTSTHVHDFVGCGCPNETFVDGGLEYHRYGGKYLDKIKDLCEYSDKEPIKKQRQVNLGKYFLALDKSIREAEKEIKDGSFTS